MTTHFMQVDAATMTDANLSLRARALYVLLAYHASDDGVIRVPLADLVTPKEGLTSVRTARTELIDRGYLTRVEPQTFGDFQFKINR